MGVGVLVFVIVFIFVALRAALVVPAQSAYLVERMGKYQRTLYAGTHLIIPFIEVIRYRVPLGKTGIELPRKSYLTGDAHEIGIESVVFLSVVDARRACYGVADYTAAITELVNSLLRSELGQLHLDSLLKDRGQTAANVLSQLEKATEPWGIAVQNYEIKTITP